MNKLTLVAFITFSSLCRSEEKSIDDLAQYTNGLSNEIGGLIIDRTITRLGDDFYFYFSQKANERLAEWSENVIIVERPTALSGSIIRVEHRRSVVYRTALSPGKKHAEDKAEQALTAMTSHLIRWNQQWKYQDTFDLGFDEL